VNAAREDVSMNFTEKELLAELDAMIAQAWGEQEGLSVRHDPALARNLECIKEDMEELFEKLRSVSPPGVFPGRATSAEDRT
jgi:hypothetical protein